MCLESKKTCINFPQFCKPFSKQSKTGQSFFCNGNRNFHGVSISFFCCFLDFSSYLASQVQIHNWCVCKKNVTGCLLSKCQTYLCGVKKESDCLFYVSTGSRVDSDWTFAKQDWIQTQKNQSLYTSTGYASQKRAWQSATLQELVFFSISQMQAWKCFQVCTQKAFVFLLYCFAPGSFCNKTIQFNQITQEYKNG